jgi:hypothetical protein
MIHLLGGVILFAGVTGHLLDTGDAASRACSPIRSRTG